MQLVTNHINKRHQDHILELLHKADEVWMATAFLKHSGLSKLFNALTTLVKAKKRITIIAGQNFALTDPKSLHALKILFENSNCRFFLAHADRPDEVFHPKLFLFRHGNTGYIISGSANITASGLSSNFECSLLVETSVMDDIWQDSLDHFNILCSPRVSQPATLFVIRQYATFFESQRIHNTGSKAVPEKTKNQIEFNYENLHRHFVEFNTPERQQLFLVRTAQYKEAKEILDFIADNPLSKGEFSKLLDRLVGAKRVEKLWYSGSLFRLRTDVKSYHREFRELVKFIRTNQHKSIAEIYNGSKLIVKRIKGAAANYIAEIMMTYNPNDCANINRNPITVLRDAGGVKLKSHSSLFTGIDYEEYSIIVKDIYTMLSLNNMLEVDSFFNEIYWKIYKPRKKK